MDRTIVYPGAIPLDTDLLSIERNVMIALGYLAQMTLGTAVVVDGLACLATTPASMTVTVGPGAITSPNVIDALAFGSLAAMPTTPLVKFGINTGAISLQLAAPTVTGQAITYLVEAAFLESDGDPVQLPYYNAANPAMPFSGPNNSGLPQNALRMQQVQVQLKAGAPGTAGTQITPAVDAGWVGLYAIVVNAGQSSVDQSSISVLPQAPFLANKLPQLSPGVRNMATFTPANQSNWRVPLGTEALRLRVWGGGGAGGAGLGGAGGGGAGGGYTEGYFTVSPGESFAVVVGGGGVGSGGAGGESSFGSLCSATGGQAGSDGASGAAGAGATIGGQGAGGSLLVGGQGGETGFSVGSGQMGGGGGGSFGCAGASYSFAPSGTNLTGKSGVLPGAGGGGGVGSGVGGAGGAGLIIVEW